MNKANESIRAARVEASAAVDLDRQALACQIGLCRQERSVRAVLRAMKDRARAFAVPRMITLVLGAVVVGEALTYIR